MFSPQPKKRSLGGNRRLFCGILYEGSVSCGANGFCFQSPGAKVA